MPAFPEVQKIRYEGPGSKNPLAFRHYNADEVVEGKPLAEYPLLVRIESDTNSDEANDLLAQLYGAVKRKVLNLDSVPDRLFEDLEGL